MISSGVWVSLVISDIDRAVCTEESMCLWVGPGGNGLSEVRWTEGTVVV